MYTQKAALSHPWGKTVLCLGQDGPLLGARRSSAWGNTVYNTIPVVLAYMNELLPYIKMCVSE